MMIKYRVHDVAKDLDVPNKEVLDILGKYVNCLLYTSPSPRDTR